MKWLVGARFWIAIVLLNLALAAVIRLGAPSEPLYSDIGSYEYVAQHGLAPSCEVKIFCHRLVVPLLLHLFPGDTETRWRVYSLLTDAAAGVVIALVVVAIARTRSSAVYATVMSQASFGFTFTAYDPFSADPAVLLVAALFALAWIKNRPYLALLLGLPGVFVKQTVALIAASGALAALLAWRRRHEWGWLIQAFVACLVLGTFMLVMRLFADWEFESNHSARITEGSWFAIWLHAVKLKAAVVHVFGTFGFAWLYAVLGFRQAPDRLRTLAIGSLPPMALLVYMQTPERALSNWFYFVIPLAVVFLSQLPSPVAWTALITNSLLTARVGLASDALPSADLLIVPAALAAGWTLWHNYRGSATPPAWGQARKSTEMTPPATVGGREASV
jgi:hypothetical protein